MAKDFERLKYCGIFDLIWQKSQDFAVLLASVSNRNSTIC